MLPAATVSHGLFLLVLYILHILNQSKYCIQFERDASNCFKIFRIFDSQRVEDLTSHIVFANVAIVLTKDGRPHRRNVLRHLSRTGGCHLHADLAEIFNAYRGNPGV